MNFLLVFIFTLACVASISSRPDSYSSSNQEDILLENSKIIIEEIRKSRGDKKELMEEIWKLREMIEELKDQIDENSTVKKQKSSCDIWDAVENEDLPQVERCYNEDHTLINKREKDVDHWTPLIYASRYGYLKIVQFLLSKGADIEKTNSLGQTPLMSAVQLKKHPVVEYLINKGANVNHQDKYKLSPLHWAVSNNDLKSIKLLIQKRANKNLKDVDGRTPLDIAKNKNFHSIESYLSN